MKVTPIETYKTYISLKNHFTQPKYDYNKYGGKVKASEKAFYKRKDRFWFEKLSRQKSDDEIKNFFIANFALADDPQTLWIGEIIRNGSDIYSEWMKRNQSLSYIFKEEVDSVFSDKEFTSFFIIKGQTHPLILKEFLRKNISIETLVILDKILGFKKNFDKKLSDPVWISVSMKLEKYSPFLNIDIFKYKKILKKVVLGE